MQCLHWTKANVFVPMKTEKIFKISLQFFSEKVLKIYWIFLLFYTKSAKYREIFKIFLLISQKNYSKETLYFFNVFLSKNTQIFVQC